jgi:hypothetical protein
VHVIIVAGGTSVDHARLVSTTLGSEATTTVENGLHELEAFDLAEPVSTFGLVDPVGEVVDDVAESVDLGRIGSLPDEADELGPAHDMPVLNGRLTRGQDHRHLSILSEDPVALLPPARMPHDSEHDSGVACWV